jgi:alpha-galactosidase
MNRIIAGKLELPLGEDGLPRASEWEKAQPVCFYSDWRGEHADPERATQVRLLWSGEYIFFSFCCRYRDIYVYEGGNSRRDKLWQRDVAEVFIRFPNDDLKRYKEFEISPNGDWLDLDIHPGGKSIIMCDLKSRVIVNSDAKIWNAELAIPIDCLAAAVNPGDIWRINLFRIEGRDPNRFYSAWRPTFTPQPNFHVPEHFGELHFSC